MDLTKKFQLNWMRVRYEPFLGEFIVNYKKDYRPKVINHTGIAILKLLNDGFSIAEIISVMKKKFPNSAKEIESDVIKFVNHLIELDGIKPRYVEDNLQNSQYRFKKIELENKPENHFYIPDRVQIEILKNCNLRCKHCYVPGTEAIKNIMSLDDIKSIIDKLDEWGIHILQISGGEPFLHPDINEIIDYAYDKNFGIQVFTNATLLEKHINASMVEKVMEFIISVDGNEEYHDKFRGKAGSFKKTLSSIKKIKELDGNIKISYSLVKDNEKYLEEVYSLMKEINVDSFVCGAPVPIGSAANLNYSVDDYRYLLGVTKNFYSKYTPSKTNKSTSDKYYGKLPAEFSCSAGKTFIYISTEGQIYPCPFFAIKDFRCGNIFEDDVENIWETSPILKQFRDVKITDVNECKGCSNCNIWCRALNYNLTKKLNGIPLYCEKINNKELE